MGWILFWVTLALVIGVTVGYSYGHATVATDCDRLGKFYVGRKVYECRRINEQTAGHISLT